MKKTSKKTELVDPKIKNNEKQQRWREKHQRKTVVEVIGQTPTTLTYSDSDKKFLKKLQEEASKLEYPPSKNKIDKLHYLKHWVKYHPSLIESSYFKMSNLVALDILCDLHEERELLLSILNQKGRSYIVEGTGGRVVRERPENVLLEKCEMRILRYLNSMKLIGSSKDGPMHDDSKNKNEWE